MPVLIVVDQPARWPLHVSGVELVSARDYLAEGGSDRRRGTVVFNLCRSYAYQKVGYYVSLLAEARGHRPQPSVATLQDLRHRAVVRIASEDLAQRIQRAFARLRSDEFQLSVYFGRTIAERYRALGNALYQQFPAPLLRARFTRARGVWQLQRVAPIAAEDVPESHRDLVVQAAEAHFAGRRSSPRRRRAPRFHLAVLVDPAETSPPSNERALRRFDRAAAAVGIATERIEREDYPHLGEYDGLFVRVTTQVNHYTYQFARRAAAEGLVVVDDPRSIIRCTNKVYLEELLSHRNVPRPRTLVVHRDNRDEVVRTLGLPCVLKQPDGSFSTGVVKVSTAEDLERELERLLGVSELVVAQEFLPTDYDWRVGVLDKRPLWVCRYFMAQGHWQIIEHEAGRPVRYGKVETIAVEDAPRSVVRTALRAANAIGDGLYGVDLKQRGRRAYVIEVNDNPNIDAGYEDRVLGDELYSRLVSMFAERMERRVDGGR